MQHLRSYKDGFQLVTEHTHGRPGKWHHAFWVTFVSFNNCPCPVHCRMHLLDCALRLLSYIFIISPVLFTIWCIHSTVHLGYFRIWSEFSLCCFSQRIVALASTHSLLNVNVDSYFQAYNRIWDKSFKPDQTAGSHWLSVCHQDISAVEYGNNS